LNIQRDVPIVVVVIVAAAVAEVQFTEKATIIVGKVLL